MRKQLKKLEDVFDSKIRETQMFLTSFDFSSIDSLDPATAEGHKIIYDQELPIELRLQDTDAGPKEVGTLEPIRCKILHLGDRVDPKHMRVELTSESDLFFHYNHSVDADMFHRMQQKQKLFIDFMDYPNVLIKMFTSCIKEPHSFLAVFVISDSGSSRLDFIQNLDYKFVELLSIEFMESPKNVMRESITFRYNSVKSKQALMLARLRDINTLLKAKNPALLLHIQKDQIKSEDPSTQSYFYGRYKT